MFLKGLITSLLTIYATDIATGQAQVEAQKILQLWLTIASTS